MGISELNKMFRSKNIHIGARFNKSNNTTVFYHFGKIIFIVNEKNRIITKSGYLGPRVNNIIKEYLNTPMSDRLTKEIKC